MVSFWKGAMDMGGGVGPWSDWGYGLASGNGSSIIWSWAISFMTVSRLAAMGSRVVAVAFGVLACFPGFSISSTGVARYHLLLLGCVGKRPLTSAFIPGLPCFCRCCCWPIHQCYSRCCGQPSDSLFWVLL